MDSRERGRTREATCGASFFFFFAAAAASGLSDNQKEQKKASCRVRPRTPPITAQTSWRSASSARLSDERQDGEEARREEQKEKKLCSRCARSLKLASRVIRKSETETYFSPLPRPPFRSVNHRINKLARLLIVSSAALECCFG